ncbi:AAA domain-containing protein [Actinophytocola oryzae]|uniref:AAA domain-containing protein n=1 Tax=Actinophytocola oryzae TaxID=502181 RepID=A0A4R7VX63_9PSEU|nr:AAA domain-containing protein [Actinophytocola oryzae]TDV53807.1 AAA domain-containing protein [Actinophytocola oryzae]
MDEQSPQVADPLVGRAVRLFEFLGRAQQLRNSPPRTVDGYRSVLWFDGLPDHPAVVSAHRGDPEPDADVLTVERVTRHDPPPADELTPWVGDPHDPETTPRLADDAPAELTEQYVTWLVAWRTWANRERVERPVRACYAQLFAAYVAASGNPEELELVVGVGCLAWEGPGVRRHLLTAPVGIRFDDDSGKLTVHRLDSVATADVELDMLDPGLVPNPRHVNEIRAAARELDTHPLHRKETGALARRLMHALDPNGEYRDDDAPPVPQQNAVAAYAPAVILRRRSQQGIVEIFTTIVDQLGEDGVVPDGLRPLVDPDHRPRHDTGEPGEGALVEVDGDAFLPLPVNETQLRIVRQVDTQAQTLVQGPPGTGKTHTAAALLSHLLAQGKRVLVTAHTDRALREVRDKLPTEFKPLSVAVVGSSREDMSDLKVAVERIAATATDHDDDAAADTIRRCLATIERLGLRRAELHDELVAVRRDEVRVHEHAGYSGTLAAIALRLRQQEPRFGWLRDHADVASDAAPPLATEEVVEWQGFLTDEALLADEAQARLRLVELGTPPAPQVFTEFVDVERAAAETEARHADLKQHPAFEAVRAIDAGARAQLRRRLSELADEADDLARRRETWMAEALADIRTGRARLWHARAQQISQLTVPAGELVARLGPLTEVTADGNLDVLVAHAEHLSAYLTTNTIRTGSDGSPKIGALTPKPVKQAQVFFENVRVNGLPPTDRQRVDEFRGWARLHKLLGALDRAWPGGVPLLPTDPPLERLAWHTTELDQLHRVLRLGEALETEQRRFAEAGLPRADWTDLDSVRRYANLVDVAAAVDAHVTATLPLRRLESAVSTVAGRADAAPCVPALLAAVRDRDPSAYATAYQRLTRLVTVRTRLARRDALASVVPPRLRAAVQANPAAWGERLARFGDAWTWASVGTWVESRDTADVNAVQAEITLTEERIRREVETLAATRAWRHAVSPDRLTGQARANLEHYAYLVRRLGKGTGKYAPQRRAEVRTAMDRCRSAVPVWIMPVYRIAEQLQIRRDMFDVVIVDEASQAGLEATFLQYLAPRMVVIGDDKQVSPTAVGVDQQRLRDLASQYLGDDPYRSAWQDPQRSLFDEAKMRYRGLLTLTEHRRCVPEIIGFSNRVAYEPDGIRLQAVRQYGADRLDPIRAVHVGGTVEGTTNKVNAAEVAAVVEQLEKCLADPRYDGKTFGVISLLGGAQAKAIERRLLERVAPEDWAARKLQCGDSADFQGAERDVMFLSMVAGAADRVVPLTREMYVQRYNVAASRARDQMWVFHSIPLAALSNQEDMRFQLLDHCYGVMSADRAEGMLASAVPPDVRVEPFDSLFEQRVANRLVGLGYAVTPSFTVERLRLDLVVVGAASRLAVLCEGDTWEGAPAYERDLATQRDLERCGWRLHRIRESAFYANETRTMAALLARLRALGITPKGAPGLYPE